MRIERVVGTTLALLLAAAPAAYAHPVGVHGGGFAAGLAHPFLGFDHLLAMLAVGMWAAQLRRTQPRAHALWAVPLAFVAVMMLAASAAVAGPVLPAIEGGLAASVLVLGLLVSIRLRLPLPAGALFVAFFAVLHGYAHGTEMPPGVSMIEYHAGFAVATATLHAAGIAGALLLSSRASLLRWLGAGIAAAGTLLVAGL